VLCNAKSITAKKNGQKTKPTKNQLICSSPSQLFRPAALAAASLACSDRDPQWFNFTNFLASYFSFFKIFLENLMLKSVKLFEIL